MSHPERNCIHCGAHINRVEAKFCEFCGTELPRPEREKNVVLPPDTTAARFRALHDHEGLSELLAHQPSTMGRTASLGCGVAFPILFIVIALGMTAAFAKIGGPMALFPLVFVAIGAVMLLSNLKKGAAFSSSPLEAVPALVADERIAVSGGGNDSSASTHYFAMLEFENGDRREFEIQSKTASIVAPGDIGIAYTKGPFLLDFKRVRT